ncbi:type I-E CRISPR-associated protein Cas5/CasD [Kaustia mangrovi]|uniref:Type I-E CRISPR-associated protein Cas5/CasD n=2 Tax=Kaustia mangrovi TaxID=2593653 RepID=A0A7S8HEF7_9HYPH|nr:type I-E CRISPR-associated protein Cas5/CasD [Kaustia mangrovi]
MPRHLVLTLEAPLMAFGGVTVDNYGTIRDFPAASMLTGLIANALGLRREDRQAHQRLQDRLVFAARHERPAGRVADFQTAKLEASDRGWTTRGAPEGRAGGAGTYLGPHLRYRDYHADAALTVVLRLEPADEAPTLDDLADALLRPARPLFIGRKPCLPSRPLIAPDPAASFIETQTVGEALETIPRHNKDALRALWPAGEGGTTRTDRALDLADERNWSSGLHGGTRRVCEGTIQPAKDDG